MRRVRQGFRRAKAVTRAHAKSFFFASYLLFGLRRKAAFALYAFCRRLDDMVDEGDGVDLPERLARARQRVAEVYLPLPELAAPTLESPAQRLVSAQAQSPWDAGELAALEYCIRHYRIPEQPFQDLISGMEMDLTRSRYASWEELELYCYRVAGVVGLMLTPVLGCADPEASRPAADLGLAMQLTNILRDVREDLERGRVYLPQDELAHFGLSEEDLQAGRVDERWRAFMRHQVARARGLYARAARGVPLLTGAGSRPMVRLMGALYGDILRDIERRDYDVFSARAHTTGSRKLALAAGTLLAPRSALPEAALPAPLLPSGGAP
ncbi:phytoene/squalene synthase family protein [Aggregicoccus sp. 17bor-14]|uniref:phytoene/squalene synthase family protein n=1 Tax=Myxococcaceae TaxID=31 RepID=UPI00129C69CA|nr:MULTISPECIES: squalene/phytoene synthase family protein [Myxococcaceae]MBF5042988.1 squalene/phytoene synthase family protein [Simulacricoccus sp. 17bor-14]MRI88754.1 phytoene/squalene synthase family protein [Aggregicoccus sp. 17bor-14]